MFMRLNKPDTPGGDNYEDSETDGSIISETETRATFTTETPVEDISFQTIRDVFNSNDIAQARSSEQRRLVEDFRTKPFEELKSRVNEKQRQADQRIGQLLNVLYLTKDTLPITTTVTTANGNIPTTSNGTSKLQKNNFIYPELFTY